MRKQYVCTYDFLLARFVPAARLLNHRQMDADAVKPAEGTRKYKASVPAQIQNCPDGASRTPAQQQTGSGIKAAWSHDRPPGSPGVGSACASGLTRKPAVARVPAGHRENHRTGPAGLLNRSSTPPESQSHAQGRRLVMCARWGPRLRVSPTVRLVRPGEDSWLQRDREGLGRTVSGREAGNATRSSVPDGLFSSTCSFGVHACSGPHGLFLRPRATHPEQRCMPCTIGTRSSKSRVHPRHQVARRDRHPPAALPWAAHPGPIGSTYSRRSPSRWVLHGRNVCRMNYKLISTDVSLPVTGTSARCVTTSS
jgi:hypothetical protein